MKKINLALTYALALGMSLSACDKKAAETASDDAGTPTLPAGGVGATGSASSDVQIPNVGSISLGGFDEDVSLSLLAEESNGCEQPNLGAFGLAIGAACHTAPLAASLLLGNKGNGDHDGDGDIDCDDFKLAEANKTGEDDGPGMLMHLMCQDIFLQNKNVTSFAFEDGEGIGISFEDFSNNADSPAVGSWSTGNLASYPADIRIWHGASFAEAAPAIAMSLKNINNGIVALDKFGDTDFQVKVEFSNNTDTSGCEANPSKETCHWQRIQIYAGEGLIVDGPPNGFHIMIYADAKENAKFMAIEGKYVYSAETAAAGFKDDNGVTYDWATNLRNAYFKTVKKGSQLWGEFHFTDANDDLVVWNVGSTNIFEGLSNGVCQNLDNDNWVDCTDITPSDYDGLWEGKDNFEKITADPYVVDWTGKPEEPGLCTTTGCIKF